MKKLILLAGLLLLTAPLFAEDLRLEGVLEDPSGNSPAIAIINGSPYKVGDSVAGSRVIEVKSNSVKLAGAEPGSEVILDLKTAPAPVAQTPVPAQESAPKTFWENVQHYRERPDQMLNPVWEFQAIRSLANINNAAVRYYEKKEFFPVKLRQLTLDGFLPVSYESGKTGKYNYYLTNIPMKPDDFQLHADPIDAGSGLRYFYVGPDAIIRVSTSGPATAQSPEFKSWFAGKN